MSSKIQFGKSSPTWLFPDEDEKLLPQGQKRVNGNTLQIRNEMSDLLISDNNIDPSITQLQIEHVTDRYKSETDRIHNSLAQRNIEKIDFSSPFYQTLDTDMTRINAIANVIGEVEKGVSKVVSVACDTPLTRGLCTVVGLSVQNLGKAIAYATPDAVKNGASDLATHLENNGVSKKNIKDIGPNLLNLGTLPIGGILGKISKVTPISKLSLAETAAEAASLVRAQKAIASHEIFRETIKKEQKLISELNLPPLNKPIHFPPHQNSFYADVHVHSFALYQVGPHKKGSLKGMLLHNDNGFFLIKPSETSHAVKAKTKAINLFESKNLLADERIGLIFNEIKQVAREKGLEKVYIAWNPEFQPLLTVLKNQSETVLSKGTFSTGLHSPPMAVVEVAVPK